MNGKVESLAGDLFGLLQALSALALLAGLFWLLRRARLGGLGRATDAAIQVESRTALDLRSALVIVRVEGRRFLLSVNEQAPARLLTELAPGAKAGESDDA